MTFARRTDSSPRPPRSPWRVEHSVLAARLLLAGCLATGCVAPATAGLEGDLFERLELATGIEQPQTVVPGFFLGGPTAELAVLHVDDEDQLRLRLYGLDEGAWAPALEAELGAGVLFVDVAEIGGRDRLLTYEAGRLSWFDPETATRRALLDVALDYRPAHDQEGSPEQPGAEIPRVDVARDLNRDGRDDLVLPDVEGFWVSVQASDGSFSDPVRLGPREPFADRPVGRLDPHTAAAGAARSYGDLGITAATAPVYLARIHEMDYDHDGRVDLVFWNGDHFDVHLQEASGRFAGEPRTLHTDVPIDADGAYTHALGYVDQGVFSQLVGFGEKSRSTVIHSLRDLNGDGVTDLVTLTLSGRSLMKQRSVFRVHLGTATADGTAFAREAVATLHPRGRAGGMQPWGYSSQLLEDFDGDGEVDMLFRDVNVGLGGMFRALVGNSVGINLELYRSEDGSYSGEATTRRRIRRFAPFAGLGNVFLPAVLMGDVNGDGLADLVVGHSPRALHVFLGVAGPGLLERRPREVAVALPSDERHTRLVDLNRDGKQDVLVHLTPTSHAPDRPYRLTTLIAR